nr:unnamed protein product [Digitaria exilis]
MARSSRPRPRSPPLAKSQSRMQNRRRRTMGIAPSLNMDGTVTKFKNAHSIARGKAPAPSTNADDLPSGGRSSIRPVATSQRYRSAGMAPRTSMSSFQTRLAAMCRDESNGNDEGLSHGGSDENARPPLLIWTTETASLRSFGGGDFMRSAPAKSVAQ